jgi:hypothetical protein
MERLELGAFSRERGQRRGLQMARNEGTNYADRTAGNERAEEPAAQWVIEKIGDLGISHDILTKHDLLDAYCVEQPRPERV